ncbi:MAG: hypothetical protein SPE43_06670 [Ruminococcus sp.]|nr:hypothetical protein [Oscillospiraceae bacterium]MDY4414027.1 hypothetical protein [Ruminococcus sp.]
MKKLLAFILFPAVFLTACSNKKAPENPYKNAEFIIEMPSGMSFRLNQSGIEVSKKGEFIQLIETDYLENYPPYFDTSPEMHFSFNDYNFDGYEDFFIPSSFETPNVSGVYYTYNAGTGLFEECEELNRIGLLMSADKNSLECCITGINSGYEDTVYKWENDKLKPVSREVQYEKDENGLIYIDTFNYDSDGNENLLKREQLILSDDGTSERKEVDIKSLYEFKVSGNSVDIIFGDKVLQTLECDYTPDENKIEFYDYDFDGNEDLFVSMKNGAMYSCGTYFRYNPFTRLYEKWDELNKIGHELAVDSENKNLYWVNNYSENYRFEKFVYKWKYQKIRLREHITGYEDSGGLWTETYSVKNSDNEELVKREKIIYDKNGNKVGCFNPDDIYFRVNKSGLDVMILGYDDSLQHISGDFYESLSEFEYAPEYYISESSEDFDSDGFKDLFIPENTMYDSKGVYYRFNPQTFQFEYWDELNKIGKRMQCGTDISETGEEFKYYYTFSIENNIRETVKYKWYNDEFLPYQKTVNRVDTVNRTTIIETYDIDYYGNETLVESYERDATATPKT